MHHGGAAVRSAPDRSSIQQIVAIDAVKTDDIMTEERQVLRYRNPYVTAMPSDQNAHHPTIGRRPATVPTDLADRAAAGRATPTRNTVVVTESLPL
jgi:hypothetical protein